MSIDLNNLPEYPHHLENNDESELHDALLYDRDIPSLDEYNNDHLPVTSDRQMMILDAIREMNNLLFHVHVYTDANRELNEERASK